MHLVVDSLTSCVTLQSTECAHESNFPSARGTSCIIYYTLFATQREVFPQSRCPSSSTSRRQDRELVAVVSRVAENYVAWSTIDQERSIREAVLTDEAIVRARFNEWDDDLDAAEQDVEVIS